MKKFCLVLGIYLLNGAWYANTKVMDKFSGNGTHQTPLEEKNNAYMFCESYEDAKRAKAGEIDWKRSSVDDFCSYSHKDDDDTWKSGWARSRLKRGCKSQLQMFGNEIYRCFDRSKDPEILGQNQAVVGDKTAIYGSWSKLYQAKAAELQAGANAKFGDIAVQLDQANKEAAAADAERNAREEVLSNASISLNAVMDQHASVASVSKSIFERFDSELKDMSEDISVIEEDSKSLMDAVNDHANVLSKKDITFDDLQKLKAEWAAADKARLEKICKDNGVQVKVERLQSYVVFVEAQNAKILTDLEAVAIPEVAEGLREGIKSKLSLMSQGVEGRSFIFDEQYEVLAEQNPACEVSRTLDRNLNAMIAATKRIEEAKRTTGILSDLQKAIDMIEVEAKDTKIEQCMSINIKGYKASVFNNVSRGEASKAKALIEGQADTLAAITSNCDLGSASKKVKANIAALVTGADKEMNETLENSLNLPSAGSMMAIKLSRIKGKILRAEMKSPSSDEKRIWDINKQGILTSLNAVIGKDIARPNFEAWPELAEYDEMLARTETYLDALIEGVKK